MTSNSIWKGEPSLEALQRSLRGTLGEVIALRFVEIGADYLRGTMPVDERTHQPYGLLHGGASVALAETLGSTGTTMTLDQATQFCVGQEINANHLRSARSGIVTGTARPVHIGGRSQVWEIHIVDESDRLVCISRLTMAVLDRR
jgi:1,4-dihydroxy-2-naphthoyl-CoA hydrolase